MAITFLQAVNRTLVKLRESEVSTLSGTDTYTKLIAAFVNEAKEEVESAWPWNSLRTYVDITTVSGTSTYSLTDMGEEFIVESVIEGNNTLQGPFPNFVLDQQIATTSIQNSSTSAYFDFVGVDSNGDPQVRLTPPPASNGTTIRFWGRKKQAYLETSTDSNTLIKLPWKPIVYLAYVKALSERGEDGGNIYDEANRQYEMALSTAIGLDSRNQHINTDWYVD